MSKQEITVKLDKGAKQRFWEKVDVGGPDECWEWQAYREPKGYGQIGINGRNEKAHRVSWVIHNGSIPDGMLICHHCDNPPCVNPEHLFMGTHQDNVMDAIQKGRHYSTSDECQPPLFRGPHPNPTRGEDSHNAKLCADEVRDIRKLYGSGEYIQQELADMFGVDQTHIGRIVRYERWAHID